jgi:hypothetical protein
MTSALGLFMVLWVGFDKLDDRNLLGLFGCDLSAAYEEDDSPSFLNDAGVADG